MLGHYLHWTRLALLATAIGFTLLLAQEAVPAQTATSRFFITRGESTIAAPIVLFPNGPLEQVHVRLANVKEPTGVSSFEVDVEVPTNLASIFFMNSNITWLQSTGRVATCSDPTFTQKTPNVTTANVSCNTFMSAPPYGATTPGGQAPPLATLYLEPGAASGNGIIKVTAVSKIVNTPINPDDLAAIPVLRQNGPVVVARCADFNADNAVSIIDIVRQVGQFGQPNPFYDLNLDGFVTIGDITITVYQFGVSCPPA